MATWKRYLLLGLAVLAAAPASATGYLYGGVYRCEKVGHCTGAITQVFPIDCDPNKADECIPVRDNINKRLLQELAADYPPLHQCDKEGACHPMTYYPFLTEQEANDNRQRDLDSLRSNKVDVLIHTFRAIP